MNNINMDNILFREIENSDFYNGYLELMTDFSNYKKDVNIENFNKYLQDNKENIKIYVALDNDNIIAAGTLFKLNKLHNNPIGQIEDVMVSEKYRKLGLGKLIVNKLIFIGLNEMKCYKIILNCLEKNILFYEKCNFKIAGYEMKYDIKK